MFQDLHHHKTTIQWKNEQVWNSEKTMMQGEIWTATNTWTVLFPTRLLTSEDEYKWYWHQMIYFPETINTISTTNTIPSTHSLVSPWLCTLLTLCMLASWSHEGAVFLDLLSSSHSVTSFLFPYLGSTDAPCSRLGDPVPPSPKWRPHSQGPRTLPCRDPEQVPSCGFKAPPKTLSWPPMGGLGLCALCRVGRYWNCSKNQAGKSSPK
jgi:hypothetical protein